MTTTAPTHEQQASRFAASVREHLSDLPEAELDELLDGLPADLAERLDDDGELGDPRQYADELRQAAGLPSRGEVRTAPSRRMRETLRETRIRFAERTSDFWAATPARRSLIEFLLALRPVWWVLRGLVLGWLLLMLAGHPVVNGLPFSFPALLLASVLVIVSVQWGRGRWQPKAWTVGLRRVTSAVAALLLLPVTGIAWNALTNPVYIESGPIVVDGLSIDGIPISSIFAFDCAGQPIDGVQLFDQNGQPLTTLHRDGGAGAEPVWGFDEERQENIVYDRNGLAGYAGMWNVFPLQEARAGIDRDPTRAEPRDATWPLAETLPLSPACAGAENAQSTTPEAGPAETSGGGPVGPDSAGRPDASGR